VVSDTYLAQLAQRCILKKDRPFERPLKISLLLLEYVKLFESREIEEVHLKNMGLVLLGGETPLCTAINDTRNCAPTCCIVYEAHPGL
jgi:hypothetical protein